jgi:hypothetical protein
MSYVHGLLLSKAICRFNAILIKIAVTFFIEIEKLILKIHKEPQKPPSSKGILSKRTKLEASHNLFK